MCKILLLLHFSFFWSLPSFAKSIFLNGIDISSASNQQMRGVDVRIDDKGHIYITAPHYQVIEEDTFTPLGIEVEKQKFPVHKKPQPIAKKDQKADEIAAPSEKKNEPFPLINQPASSQDSPD